MNRYGAFIAALLVSLAFAPAVDDPADNLRVVEIGMSVLISIVLVNGAVLYWRRSKRGEMLLTGPEYVVVIGCILTLLTAATLVVIENLSLGGRSYTATLILCVIVQPPLLWWAIRMEKRLEA